MFSESTCCKGSNESLWYGNTRLYLEKKSDGKELLPSVIRHTLSKRRTVSSANVEDIPTIIFYENDDLVRNIIAYTKLLPINEDNKRKLHRLESV